MRAARFKRDVKRRALGIVSTIVSIAECLDLRMRPACGSCAPTPDNLSAFHQHRTHGRIRRSETVATPRKSQSQPHELNIRHRCHRSDMRSARQSRKP